SLSFSKKLEDHIGAIGTLFITSVIQLLRRFIYHLKKALPPLEMMMNLNWLAGAANRYEGCIRSMLELMLERPPLKGSFVDTKIHSVTGENYGAHSGLRGPDFTYGWIQARALEALLGFAEFYRDRDAEFSERLIKRARILFDAMRALQQRDGHIFFLYNKNMEPIRPGPNGNQLQSSEPDIFTYSDAFSAKGLFAASKILAPDYTAASRAYLLAVIDAVEAGRFQMDESVSIRQEAAAMQPDDFGPRMILLGAAGLLHRLGESKETGFADRFIDHVLERHYDPKTGLLLNIPGEDKCNVGHIIEFCGFAFDHLLARPQDTRLENIGLALAKSLEYGLQGPGIALYLSAHTGQAISPYYPWWPMPEAIRACALGLHLGLETGLADYWQRADQAFFTHYWQPEKGYAFQTRNISGPVDFVPATPDLDPAYHTGLSLLAANRAISQMLLA
ncbi:MAG: hypothetical protein VW520_06585, partial [Candidatus Puniceispirillum sp.]